MINKMKKEAFAALIIFILLCEIAGIIGSAFTQPAINSWYVSLQKPIFNPPNWIFAPVWTILYALMGISAFLVWRKGLKRKEVQTALIIFSIQLALNIAWSILFFGLHLPLYAFLEILLLWISISLTISRFYRISKPAALMMLPYLAWVSFAAVLNLAIVLLN